MSKYFTMLPPYSISRKYFSFIIKCSIGLMCFSWLSTNAMAENQWELKKSCDGIKVYTRNVDSSEVKVLKVELIAKGNLKKLRDILLDIPSQKDWVYSTMSSSLVKRISDHEVVYYSEKKMPWPVADRDAVMDIKIMDDPATNTMTVNVSPVNNLVPVKKNIIRVHNSKISWTVTEVNNDTLRIEYLAQVDPGGNVPAWVINLFMTKGPYETFKRLRSMLNDGASS